MACSFSANQYEREFTAPKLCNWQVPKWHPSRPIQRTKPTKIISNDRGHLLPGISRPVSNPWGHFKGTWQLPDKISKQQALQISKPHSGDSRWAKPSLAKRKPSATHADEAVVAPEKDLQYIPGDLTLPKNRHPSRILLEQQHREKQRPSSLKTQCPLDGLYLEQHDCTDPVAQLNAKADERRTVTPHVLGEDIESLAIGGDHTDADEMTREVTEKPGERNTSPIIPAYCNFQVARKMHVENLEHQPLPDSIMDRAFRRLQAQGAANPELALNVFPTATGVGVKTYMAGPTHCTKLKVFRPKTCGVVPKPMDRLKYSSRPHTCNVGEKEKMGAMDLAICWDYRPADPRDEPKRPAHIDGSNESAGPAVFTLVKTPRTPNAAEPMTGRSGGVFSNTLGENDFFDKDIMRQHAQFGCKSAPVRACTCGRRRPTKEAEISACRPRSVSRANHLNGDQVSRSKRCKSSPNLSQVVNVDSDTATIHLHHQHRSRPQHQSQQPAVKCSHHSKTTQRLCEQQPPAVIPDIYQASRPKQQTTDEYKQAFKAGIPKSNSSGTCTSFDSGCSSMSSTTCSSKTVRVPKPRHPYAKRDYVIDTLAPPFACWRGGAGQGGYPEHSRLASVYQHAYKPIEQRKRPLLATVYQ